MTSLDLAALLGVLGAAAGVTMVMPQVHRLHVRRQHVGVSLMATTLGFLTGLAWLLYGLAVHRLVQILTPGVVAVLSLAVLVGLVVQRRPPRLRWVPLLVVGSAVLVSLGTALTPARMGAVAVVLSVVGQVPQLSLLARARLQGPFDIEGLALSRFVLNAAGNVCWLGYGLILRDRVVCCSATLITILSVSVIALARRFSGPTELAVPALARR